MSNEQRTRILQRLYEGRSEFPYILDREELASRLGKPWDEIQPDVAYLEKEGYLVTERREIISRIFHILSITNEGIKFVEKPPLRRIEVFISSPGDVSEERRIAKCVIERFNRMHSFAERYVLRPLAYEDSTPAEVGNRPQTIVDRRMIKAGSSDLFICILWRRMGTPLIHEETGARFQSGTEYEFLDAYHNNQAHGKPYILLYRGMKPSPEAEPEQLRVIEDFFKRFEGELAEFKGLYKIYRSNEAFETMLFDDIEAALSKNLIA